MRFPANRTGDQPPGAVQVTAGNDCRVDCLTTDAQLRQLGEEWEALTRSFANNNVFMSWAWTSSWWTAFGHGFEPRILVAYHGDTLVGIAPFVMRRIPFRHSPLRQISLIGNVVGAADHLDLVCDPNYRTAVTNRFVEYLTQRQTDWDVIRLDGMSSHSSLLSSLRSQSGWTSYEWKTNCPYLKLPQTCEEFVNSLSSSMRTNFRRREKRLAEATQGNYQIVRISDPAELPAAMDDLFRLHQKMQRQSGNRGAFHDPSIREFHRQLSEQLLKRDQLGLFLLRANGRAIGAAYCFCCGNRVMFYQSGYDSEWSRFSPGNRVMLQAILNAVDAGAEEFDFLRGTQEYKRNWTKTARVEFRIRVAATPLASICVRATRWARESRDRFRYVQGKVLGKQRESENPELFELI